MLGKPIPQTLSDAIEKYRALGKGPRNKIAQGQFDRAWDVMFGIIGDALLTSIRRDHANQFVAKLIDRDVTPDTIGKYLSQIRPVIGLAIREFEIDMINPFEKVVIPDKGTGKRYERDPYELDQLRAIQKRCREVNDQRRWAIATASDTGARLAEIVGIRKDAVALEAPVPYITIAPNEIRGVKTEESVRKVPLVGEALWAVGQAMTTEGPYLFPVFQPKRPGKAFNAGTASAALIKWLRENKLATERQGMHSFRHTLEDRLRNAGVPKDVRDRIGGWKVPGVGESYGDGFSLGGRRTRREGHCSHSHQSGCRRYRGPRQGVRDYCRRP
ncbi:site-specific integrase [Paenirhodobacter sp.]|uniref:site-specific integrase n=1 Tax=Paenirhodobacter sp. TaxID=1965326 RepID=UPI003B3D7566